MKIWQILMKIWNNKNLVFVLTAVLVILTDQASKYLVKSYFVLGQSTVLIPKFLFLTYIQNTGAGFGLLKDMESLLIWIAVLVVGIIMYYYGQFPNKRYVWVGTALVFGGAIGNAISRIWDGFVVDFIGIGFWPVFNFADTALTIGVVLLIIYFLKNK